MKKKTKKTSYTVMFVPDDNGKTFYVRINRYLIYSVLFFLIIFVIGISALLLRSGEIGTKLQLTYSLLRENKRLTQENKRLREITKKIETIETTSDYLRRLAAAVGEATGSVSIAKLHSLEKEKLLTEDSLDAFIGDLRADASEIYEQAAAPAVSRKELSTVIPNISPVDGWITRGFVRDAASPKNNHLGLDFAAKIGTPIRATAPGVVVEAVNEVFYGLIVTVKHDFSYVTRYGHCSQILVAPGDHVKRGQTIALIGNTGQSSAPHVHYEIIKDGKNVDPQKYILERL